MRLRSKGTDKQRIDDELEAREDAGLLRLGRPAEAAAPLAERKEPGPLPQGLRRPQTDR